MVEEWAAAIGCAKPAYVNDGSVIRDWSHLLLSRGEFKAALEATSLAACAGLSEVVTHYVYDHSDLNRTPYEDIVASLERLHDVDIVQVRHSAQHPLTAALDSFAMHSSSCATRRGLC